MTTMLHRHGD